ncbi:hypothetical protein [[Clostridium] polysaccharolyticum]|uniref:FtsX-like permease family protein n=1 Tax=[Clostridium] polysaccharolyticum TaxID=29364 RepID=A0A1I0ASB7_9FIRM|nr:hypothetical protein [[Clostridium] polysaccharolyticum]SES97303.1 hypothetical protein SAMN04487772_10624 [[Clostridium] polysaccharolyticum]
MLDRKGFFCFLRCFLKKEKAATILFMAGIIINSNLLMIYIDSYYSYQNQVMTLNKDSQCSYFYLSSNGEDLNEKIQKVQNETFQNEILISSTVSIDSNQYQIYTSGNKNSSFIKTVKGMSDTRSMKEDTFICNKWFFTDIGERVLINGVDMTCVGKINDNQIDIFLPVSSFTKLMPSKQRITVMCSYRSVISNAKMEVYEKRVGKILEAEEICSGKVEDYTFFDFLSASRDFFVILSSSALIYIVLVYYIFCERKKVYQILREQGMTKSGLAFSIILEDCMKLFISFLISVSVFFLLKKFILGGVVNGKISYKEIGCAFSYIVLMNCVLVIYKIREGRKLV